MTIQEFIAKYPFTITSTRVPVNPNFHNDSIKMFNYMVTLTHNKKDMFLFYSMGYGHWQDKRTGKRVSVPFAWNYDELVKILDNKKFYASYFNTWGSGKGKEKFTNYNIDSFLSSNIPAIPTVENILECFVSDFYSTPDFYSFEQWAMDLGYDTDSRKAEQTYNTIQKQAKEFESLVGYQAFKEFKEIELD